MPLYNVLLRLRLDSEDVELEQGALVELFGRLWTINDVDLAEGKPTLLICTLLEFSETVRLGE